MRIDCKGIWADDRIFIVMPFIEHDLKTLLADMPHPLLQSEVKTLMMQLISAVGHCHANWIVGLPNQVYARTDR